MNIMTKISELCASIESVDNFFEI